MAPKRREASAQDDESWIEVDDRNWGEKIGVTRPHSARVYDYWLGGKDNFAADRALAGHIAHEALATMPAQAIQSRAFTHRATRFLAVECGIDQFLDIGTGIPMYPNVHELAQATNPSAAAVYVDNDPIVLAHARALLCSPGPGWGPVTHLDADLLEPKKLLADPVLASALDLDRPVGLMLTAVLSDLWDDQDPWDCVRVLMDALPSGSYMVVSHLGYDFAEDVMDRIKVIALADGMTLVPRTREQVERFFVGWELVEPGVVPVGDWRSDVDSDELTPAFFWGGVARKP